LPRIARNGSEAEKKESRGNREMKKSTFLRLARSVLRLREKEAGVTLGLVILARWGRSPVVQYLKENFMRRNKSSCRGNRNGGIRSLKKENKLRRAWPRPNLSVKLVRKSGIIVPKADNHPY
jgi:hypothetical protein